MYGKIFSSAFTGSMFGAGADVFAVWSYVIANTIDSRVELNPRLLAAAIGTEEQRVRDAIKYLCEPDPHSRNKQEEGRRLIREGEFQYFVTGHSIYRKLQNEDGRREYNRTKQAESRARRAAKEGEGDGDSVKQSVIDSQPSNSQSLTVNDGQQMSAQAEAKANGEAEAKANIQLQPVAGGRLPLNANAGEGEPEPSKPKLIDLALIPWSDAVRLAESVAVKYPPANAKERRVWFKYGAVAAAMLGEGWLAEAMAKQRNSKAGPRKGAKAQFVGILKATAAEVGIDLPAMRKEIEIPADVWNSSALGGPQKNVS